MPVGGHSSLLDELDEVENENELQQTQDSATPAGVKQNQLPLQAHTLPIAGSAAAAAPSNPSAVGAEAAIPAHTPLAKYLQRLAGAPEEAEEAEEETVTDADAPLGAEAEDGANDAAVPSVPASASAAAAHAADATSTRASLLSSLLLEVAAPALAAVAAPSRTLSHRSKRWCVRLCVDAAHTADSGDRSDARLQPQLGHLSAQLGQIRLLHLAALALAALQLLCCSAQLLLAFAQHLGLFALLPLLLGSSASIAVPAPVGTQWLPSVYLVLCAVALLNAAAAYVSPLRSLLNRRAALDHHRDPRPLTSWCCVVHVRGSCCPLFFSVAVFSARLHPLALILRVVPAQHGRAGGVGTGIEAPDTGADGAGDRAPGVPPCALSAAH